MKSSSASCCASNFTGLGSVSRHFLSARRASASPTAATALLSNHKNLRVFGRRPELRERENVDAIVIDPLPALKDPEDQQTLCAWIREKPSCIFCPFAAACRPAGSCRSAFYGGFCSSSRPDRCLIRDNVRCFSEKNGCTPTEAEINVIIHDSLGYRWSLTGAFAPDAKRSALYAGDRRHCAAGNLSLF